MVQTALNTRCNKLQVGIDAYVDMLICGGGGCVEGVLCLPKQQWDIFNQFRAPHRSPSEPMLTYTYFLYIRGLGIQRYRKHESIGLYAVWYTTHLRNPCRR